MLLKNEYQVVATSLNKINIQYALFDFSIRYSNYPGTYNIYIQNEH